MGVVERVGSDLRNGVAFFWTFCANNDCISPLLYGMAESSLISVQWLAFLTRPLEIAKTAFAPISCEIFGPVFGTRLDTRRILVQP